jgi:hypothetical protein
VRVNFLVVAVAGIDQPTGKHTSSMNVGDVRLVVSANQVLLIDLDDIVELLDQFCGHTPEATSQCL